MSEIIFIVGPTAIGKTEAAFLLAKKLKAEIISADSMLIYREPEIITSKPPAYMLSQVKHHFIGGISVQDSYSVFDYHIVATQKILDLYNKDISVVVCGGSGLYIKALLDGIFQGPGKNENLRKQLYQQIEIHGNEYLFKKLEKVDPETTGRISVADSKRIVRALEVFYISRIPISIMQKKIKGLWQEMKISIFGLVARRDKLYERINKRTDVMFELGAVGEVKRLLGLNLSLTAAKIIGLKEISDYLNGKFSGSQARNQMKKNTRNFAKRQLTWFRKDKRIDWIDVGSVASEEITATILDKIYE